MGTFEFGGISFSAISLGISPPRNSSSEIISAVTSTDCKLKPMETERWDNPQRSRNESHGLSKSAVPTAPHLENCKLSAKVGERLDKRAGNESFPPWTTWNGLLDMHPASTANEQHRYFRHQAMSDDAYPPWITGSDEDNYPLTRKCSVTYGSWFQKWSLRYIKAIIYRVWVDPWSYLQPTTEVNGSLLTSHRKMDLRWCRAQANDKHACNNGDKACEMEVVEFEEYMQHGGRIKQRFPHLNSIWLSTEMQEVIDKSKHTPIGTFTIPT
ncbi:hypothetical protein GH714_023048 [Hevea brasiliensis]|uniref:Uncharacterized protein n=1 Tax=Hevea brasiliensis TaxID=3981 RepID=A0A6A6M2F1_HEVBR|nr:hypothetical protein GH714_023048 [Hevea brasiliensis]